MKLNYDDDDVEDVLSEPSPTRKIEIKPADNTTKMVEEKVQAVEIEEGEIVKNTDERSSATPILITPEESCSNSANNDELSGTEKKDDLPLVTDIKTEKPSPDKIVRCTAAGRSDITKVPSVEALPDTDEVIVVAQPPPAPVEISSESESERIALEAARKKKKHERPKRRDRSRSRDQRKSPRRLSRDRRRSVSRERRKRSTSSERRRRRRSKSHGKDRKRRSRSGGSRRSPPPPRPRARSPERARARGADQPRGKSPVRARSPRNRSPVGRSRGRAARSPPVRARSPG